MALAPLATVADLALRGVDTTNTAQADALLAAASEAVRDAAGSTISTTTSTVTLMPNSGHWLDAPGAVSEVASVSIDGAAVTDFRVIGGRIWREAGWLTGGWHAPVTITYTHGLADVPADIVDLVCSLVAGAMRAAEDDAYDSHRDLTYESIDDYRRGFQQGDDALTSPFELPQRTREWLRARFGGGVAVVGTF